MNNYYQKQMFEADDRQEQTQDQSTTAETKNAETKPEIAQPEDKRKYSDKEVDAIIDRKLKKWKEQQEKAVKEAEKLATMTEQERAEHEKAELMRELNDLRAEKAKSQMTQTVRKMLKDQGLTDLDDVIIDGLIREDADQTAAAVKSFSAAFSDAIQKKLAHQTPQTGTPGRMTKQQILSVKDKNTRRKLIAENIQLFK